MFRVRSDPGTGESAFSNENMFSVKRRNENNISDRHEDTKRDEREGKDGTEYASGLAWGQCLVVKNKRIGKSSREVESPSDLLLRGCRPPV